jgi:hypothetical protein
MEGRERAELKNKILQYLVDDSGHSFPVSTLYKNLGESCKSQLQFKDLLDEMKSTGINYFDVHNHSVYESYCFNDSTKDFLDEGGFVNQYESELDAENERLKLEAEERTAMDVARNKDKMQLRLSKWQLYTFWPVFIFGLFGGLYSLYQIFNKPHENKTDTKLYNRVEQLETNQEELENGLKKQNDSLKNELHKAEMLLGIYESEN